MQNLNNTFNNILVFFQMCRAHAIGWDVRSKIGTLFTLMDTVKRENIGMIYCGNSLKDAIYNFARGLHVIHQEISAPNMQGKLIQLLSENQWVY